MLQTWWRFINNNLAFIIEGQLIVEIKAVTKLNACSSSSG